MPGNIKKIITYPNPILTQRSEEVRAVDESTRNLIDDLIATVQAASDPPGVGLSAVQIGILKRVFVAMIRKRWKPFVNPQIVKFSPEKADFLEGCLSVPEFYGHVLRPAQVEVVARDRMGRKFSGKYSGLPSRIIQHEMDHLNGKLFIEHVHAQGGKLYKITGKDKEGKDVLEETTIT